MLQMHIDANVAENVSGDGGIPLQRFLPSFVRRAWLIAGTDDSNISRTRGNTIVLQGASTDGHLGHGTAARIEQNIGSLRQTGCHVALDVAAADMHVSYFATAGYDASATAVANV